MSTRWRTSSPKKKPSGPVRAVVLLSGGLDSSTTLAIARLQGFEVVTLTLEYGQRHRQEIDAARRIAKSMGVTRHVVTKINLTAPAGFGGSALTGDGEVPHGRSDAEIGAGVPITYVPARNLIFLSFATALAEIIEADNIFIGVNAIDYSGYPDCRPEFIRAFAKTAQLATRAGMQRKRRIRVHAPIIKLTKAEIVRKGLELGVDFSLTHSCYDPDAAGRACGECDSCKLRLRAFEQAGAKDPIEYSKSSVV